MKACPLSFDRYPVITMAHGGGGRLMQQLIHEMFVHAFDNPYLKTQHDGAIFSTQESKYAFTTDSYVVSPLFFPGGDIGKLAVYGTVNDLAMCGARPQFLSLGLILEEGLSMEVLWQVIQSIADAAKETKVQIVTGDTKVVERGSGDHIFINTTGIGEVFEHTAVSPLNVRPGDAILVSGDLGRHGIAVLQAREQLGFSSEIQSDCAPLTPAVRALFEAGIEVHCLRDLTRGGLASALYEICQIASCSALIHERDIQVHPAVRGASEMLGLDPLYIANEGRFIAIVKAADKDKALQLLKSCEVSREASVIGQIEPKHAVLVHMESLIGTKRAVDMLSGEQLPRIC